MFASSGNLIARPGIRPWFSIRLHVINMMMQTVRTMNTSWRRLSSNRLSARSRDERKGPTTQARRFRNHRNRLEMPGDCGNIYMYTLIVENPSRRGHERCHTVLAEVWLCAYLFAGLAGVGCKMAGGDI